MLFDAASIAGVTIFQDGLPVFLGLGHGQLRAGYFHECELAGNLMHIRLLYPKYNIFNLYL